MLNQSFCFRLFATRRRAQEKHYSGRPGNIMEKKQGPLLVESYDYDAQGRIVASWDGNDSSDLSSTPRRWRLSWRGSTGSIRRS